MISPRPRNYTDLVQTARRHLPALILPVLVVTIASTAALFLMPGEYSSSATLLPESSKNESLPLESTELAPRVHQHVTDRVRIEKLIETLDLNRNDGDKNADHDSLVAQIQKMRNNIGVNPGSDKEDGKNAVTISYRDPDPETARTVTANLVEQIVAGGIPRTQAGEVPADVEALQKRALELSSKLREFDGRTPGTPGQPVATRENSSAPSTSRGSQLPGEAWRAPMNVESLNDQLYKLGQQIADLNSRIAGQRLIVEEQRKGSTLNSNPTYALLITRRAELQGQRDNLINRQELTDKHPRVLAILDQITAINNQVEELRKQQAGTLSQTPEARELLALEAERRRLQLELEVNGREVKRRMTTSLTAAAYRTPAPAPAQRNADSSREYQRLKQEYNDVVVKLQDAPRGAEAGSVRVERFRLLRPASVARNLERPNAILVGLVAAAAGLAVGACFALALDQRRCRTLHNADDVEHYTRLPLLAAIPRRAAEEEERRLKSRARALLATGVAVAIAATVALTKLLVFTEVLAGIGNR